MAAEAEAEAAAPVPRDRTFHLDGASFVVDASGQVKARDLSGDTFLLRKTERAIEYYRLLAQRRPRHILELGMREGGSIALWDKLYAPEVLVGLDPRGAAIEAVELYRADRPHIRTYYGRNPDKPGAVMAARESFPTGPDLIIDDASHRYEETKTTFESLFPLLRPGGTYVVEGWNWSHRPAAQKETHPGWQQKALTNLLFELTVLTSNSRVIEHLHVEEGLFAVRKGSGTLPAGGLATGMALRGRELPDI